jgi:hypothetical protein
MKRPRNRQAQGEEVSKLNLTELIETARAATPGPWHKGSSPALNSEAHFVEDAERERMIAECWDGEDDLQRKRDAAHIAAFDPPTAIALCEALREAVDTLKSIGTSEGVSLEGPGAARHYERVADRALSKLRARGVE